MNSFSASDFIEFVKNETLSAHLIREVHSKIMTGTDMDEKHIGVFRYGCFSFKRRFRNLEVCPFLDIPSKIAEMAKYFSETKEDDP